jgi:hypothetical protein
MVINLKDLDMVVEQVGLRVFAACQRLQIDHKLPLTHGPEYIEFEATVLVSPAALNAIRRTQEETTIGEAVVETVNPEVVTTAATQRSSEAKTLGTTKDKAVDDTTGSSQENATDSSTDKNQRVTDGANTQKSSTVQTHATADDTTTSNYS